MNFFALCCCVVVLSEVHESLSKENLKNGTDARRHIITLGTKISLLDSGRFPFQASIQRINYHVCGGTVISEKFILTACHCTRKKDVHLYSVRVGTIFREREGEVFQIKLPVFEHPNCDLSTGRFDVAILQLNGDITFSDLVIPIKMAEDNFIVPVGSNVTVTGWGKTETGHLAPTLVYVLLPVISNEACNKSYADEKKYIESDMMCTLVEGGGRDACQGDSGGPVVFDYTLVGVISWGKGCGLPDRPGVISKVAASRSWIKEVTGI